MPIPPRTWHRRLADGLAHDLGLVIAKAVHGQLVADVPRADIVRQVALSGRGTATAGAWVSRSSRRSQISCLCCRRRKRISACYSALAPCGGGLRRRCAVAGTCGAGTGRNQDALKRWLQRWTKVRHREAAERPCSRNCGRCPPAVLADALLAGRPSVRSPTPDTSLDFINKAFECLDLIGWRRSARYEAVVGQMVAAVAPKNRQPGASPLTLLRSARKRAANCRNCSLPAAVRTAGRITQRSPELLGDVGQDR